MFRSEYQPCVVTEPKKKGGEYLFPYLRTVKEFISDCETAYRITEENGRYECYPLSEEECKEACKDNKQYNNVVSKCGKACDTCTEDKCYPCKECIEETSITFSN